MTSVELVIFDFDGTLAEQRGSWGLLYRLFGTEQAGTERTDDYWETEMTFKEWCQGNVADLHDRGVHRTHLNRAANAIKLTEGVPKTLDALNKRSIKFGVISSGVSNLMHSVDAYDPAFVISNTITFDEAGVPTGVNATVGPNDKGRVLTQLCEERGISPDAIGYVGDSHSDIEAFEVAGRAILFDPDGRIKDADHKLADTVVHTRDMFEAYLSLFPNTSDDGPNSLANQ